MSNRSWELSVARVEYGGHWATGWLCSSDGHLLTCGHLFAGDEKNLPLEGVPGGGKTCRVRFSGCDAVDAEVVRFWRARAGGVDFAVLRVAEDALPGHVMPLPVGEFDRCHKSVTLYGYAEGQADILSPEGGNALGLVREAGEGDSQSPDPRVGLLKVECARANEYGFSGSPIYCDDTGEIIAMQSGGGEEGKPDVDCVYAMPVSRALELWEPLTGLVAWHNDDASAFGSPVASASMAPAADGFQLVLEIGCDGKSFVPTAKALDVLTEIDADRMNGTGSQAEVSSVKFRYVDLDLIYKMLIGTVRDANGQEIVDAGLLGPQLLAYNRTRVEKRMGQAVRFAMNDSRIDALSGRADDLIDTEYLKSDNWRGRLHVNEYGLRLPYKRAFLWERVLVRSLAFLKDPSLLQRYDFPQDQDCVHIDCACRESRNEWYLISTIHLSREDDSEREKLSRLHCVQFPCDMYDVRTRDLVYRLYPDLCWSVGHLIVTWPEEYERIVGKYGDEVFHWDNMLIWLH